MSKTRLNFAAHIAEIIVPMLSIGIMAYPFWLKQSQTAKIIALVVGGIGLGLSLRYIFTEWLTEEVMGSDDMTKLKQDQANVNATFENEITYLKGWLKINPSSKNKKGASRAIDPIMLITFIIIIILIILVLKGKI